MRLALVFLSAWFLLSIPVGFVVGRALREARERSEAMRLIANICRNELEQTFEQELNELLAQGE